MTEPVLTPRALNRALLARQMLLARECVPAQGAVARLVGLQAQQARPPFVGLWSRLDGFEAGHLLELLRAGAVLRATLMRGTLHLMTAEDYAAFRPALQPALTSCAASILRDRDGEFSLEAVLAAARELYREAPRRFADVRDALAAKFPSADVRAMGYAVRMELPLAMVPTTDDWGYPADAAFALADSECPPGTTALDALVTRYLAAFGPATVADFQAWSGLRSMAGVFARLRPQLMAVRDNRGRELFDMPASPRPSDEAPAPCRLIADYDNLILAHADRSRILPEEHRSRVVTRNLIVLPTFLVDGFVAGTWKLIHRRRVGTLTLTPFQTLTSAAREALATEGESLSRFLDRDAGFDLVVE